MAEGSETIFDDPEGESSEDPKDQEESSQEQPEVKEGPEKGQEPPEGEEDEGGEEQSFLFGTTFKTGDELAKAYKELQGSFTRGQQESSEMKKELTQVKQDMQDLLKRMFPKQEAKIDPEAFMKSFVSDPTGTLQKLMTEAYQTQSKESLGTLEKKINRLEGIIELQYFRAEHPEFGEEDVEPFLKIIDSYPEVRPRQDRMEIWYKLLKDQRPEIGQRTTKQKQELEKEASDAKRAATLGGKKSSASRASEGDEFDEILKMDAERQKLYQR